MSNTHTCE